MSDAKSIKLFILVMYKKFWPERCIIANKYLLLQKSHKNKGQMVLEIRISNMFSIKDEIVLSMMAGNSKSKKALELQGNTFPFKDENVLKSIAIYGANASGKSSIIKAIIFCCAMVLNSHNHNEGTIFGFKPFKFDGYPSRASTFFIRFTIGGIEYEYSFSMNAKEILTEELYYYPKGRKAKVFVRDERKSKHKREVYSFTPAIIKRPQDVAENTSKKTLFISRASQMDRDIAKDIYSFFHNSFIFSKSIGPNSIETLFTSYKSILLTALQIADSDIVDIKMRKEKVKAKQFFADIASNTASINDVEQETIKFTTYHKRDPRIAFDFDTEESDGTKNMFHIMLGVLDIVRNGKALLWDEIERSLHSKIVEYIFTLFNNSKSAQLICTTHNTNLLDLDKLRRDQIYFVNKKEDASSDLYSLFDYKDFREGMDAEKAYLQGRFDAIPYINDSESNLKILLDNE